MSALAFVGCGLRPPRNVTPEEYGQLKSDMSYRQVVTIIGAEPDKVDHAKVPRGASLKTCTWKNKDGSLVGITFEGDKARLIQEYDPAKPALPR
ncbi:hypothetical protein EON80_31080 [bacterium]|nr:MAG: hypothetical protein EON80_31080 [bacterium]